LPEEATLRTGGIDRKTRSILQEWMAKYCGHIPLTVSRNGAAGLPTCNLFSEETGLNAFAHIDASGILKTSSYDVKGIQILENGVMAALNKLPISNQEINS
jgi:hypothetical protein